MPESGLRFFSGSGSGFNEYRSETLRLRKLFLSKRSVAGAEGPAGDPGEPGGEGVCGHDGGAGQPTDTHQHTPHAHQVIG